LLLGLPDTFPRALSSDFSQETCPSQPLGERLRRKNRLLEACIQGKSPLIPLLGFERRRSMRHSIAWRTALLTVMLIVLVTLGLPLGFAAQRPGHIPRIAFLDLNYPPAAGEPTPLLDAFRHGLLEHGWVEGHTIAIEWRWAEGSLARFADPVAEVLRLPVAAG